MYLVFVFVCSILNGLDDTTTIKLSQRQIAQLVISTLRHSVSSKMADALEDHVTCSICLGLYNDPLALPCMHSFCRRCLQGIVASSMCLKVGVFGLPLPCMHKFL